MLKSTGSTLRSRKYFWSNLDLHLLGTVNGIIEPLSSMGSFYIINFYLLLYVWTIVLLNELDFLYIIFFRWIVLCLETRVSPSPWFLYKPPTIFIKLFTVSYLVLNSVSKNLSHRLRFSLLRQSWTTLLQSFYVKVRIVNSQRLTSVCSVSTPRVTLNLFLLFKHSRLHEIISLYADWGHEKEGDDKTCTKTPKCFRRVYFLYLFMSDHCKFSFVFDRPKSDYCDLNISLPKRTLNVNYEFSDMVLNSRYSSVRLNRILRQ